MRALVLQFCKSGCSIVRRGFHGERRAHENPDTCRRHWPVRRTRCSVRRIVVVAPVCPSESCRLVVDLEPGCWILSKPVKHPEIDAALSSCGATKLRLAVPRQSAMHASWVPAALACAVPASGGLVITHMHMLVVVAVAVRSREAALQSRWVQPPSSRALHDLHRARRRGG